MFLKKLLSTETRLKLIIALILAVSLFIFMLYAQQSEKKHSLNEASQVLYAAGKAYEYEISSEFTKCGAISELLATTFSKSYNQPDFKSEIKGIFKELLYKHERLQSISLVLSNGNTPKDSSALFFSIKDSLTDNIIRINKSALGISEDFTSHEFSSLRSKVAILKTIEASQTKILAPEIQQSGGRTISVVPFVTSLYAGRQYIGYLVMNITLDWLKEKGLKNKPENLEAYVSTGTGQIFALNKSGYLLTEPISKVCLSCQDLIVDKGISFNTSIVGNYFTLCYPIQLDNSMEVWHICLRSPLDAMNNQLGYNLWYWWLIFIVLLFAGLLAALVLINRNENFWHDLINISDGILKGKIELNKFEITADKNSKAIFLKTLLFKIGQVSNELITKNKSVLAGNYNENFDNDIAHYEIIDSAKSIYSALEGSNIKLKKSLSELAQNNKFNEDQDKISQVLQLHYRDINDLSEKFIHSLVDLLGISMGAIFLLNNEDQTLLELIISYAYSENRNQKKNFKIGESLVGACAAEQRTIYLKKLPDNYLSIVSGLGLASPKSVLLVPMLFESKVLGVIELGSLMDFEENQIKFVETSALKIASTLSLSQNNLLNSELLEKTRLQAVKLEEHDKKTLDALNELKLLHEKTAQNEAAVRYKLEAMNNTLMMVEYTAQGILVEANYKFLNTMHYSIEEIRGINVLDLLRDNEREELMKIIENVKAGNFFEGIMQRHTKLGHEKWFLSTYTPVYNKEGNVENILFFAIDITRIRTKEDQLKKKTEELKRQIADLKNIRNV